MPNITQQLAFVDTHLKINEWFAGEHLTGADFQMSFPLEAAVHRGLCKDYSAITQWVERIQNREAYKSALAKGGVYEFA
jgi:glutathione S-transferase